MDNVHNLQPSTIPPWTVINSLTERLPIMSAIYAVTIENGQPVVYASGDLKSLCLASTCLQNLALDFVNGRVEER